jgi:hypothetical protein
MLFCGKIDVEEAIQTPLLLEESCQEPRYTVAAAAATTDVGDKLLLILLPLSHTADRKQVGGKGVGVQDFEEQCSGV